MSKSYAFSSTMSSRKPEAGDGARGNLDPAPRLLIVDDVSDNRAVLTRRFQSRGFQIVEAENGLEALELIETGAFDLVLLDIVMPGIDGIETLRRIRSQRSPSELPVIMVTAKAENTDVVHALEAGANDYVTKPVDFAVALARVNTQLSRKKAERLLIEANRKLNMEIALREESQAQSHYLAYHDPLTGLGNRLLFKSHLETILGEVPATAHPIAVLLLDLDGFKGVNEALGHSVGDLLLKSIAGRLRDILQATDRIARLGGDEFAILQTSMPQPASSVALAEKIIELTAATRSIDGHDVTVGASVGIAIGEPGEIDAGHFLKRADLAMYGAKSGGRGTYRIFDPEMDCQVQARRLLERDMRQGLVQNCFRLHYQPLVNLQTRKVTGFEALMRWQHPERGLVSPLEFVPFAEEIGLIVPLGEWALRQACSEAMNWPDDIGVAVNLSPVQFKKGSLASAVVSALASSGLPASRLELEVTESILLEKSDSNIEILNQLRGLGVRISMDDFGTGYSSIGYLRNFRFDKIKIDRSFVQDLMEDDGCLAIVRAVVGLGKSFGIRTIAEGVETEAQLERLALEGCTEVQGYLYSRPVPADQVPALLAEITRKRLAFEMKNLS
ncbi:putative bifunctional diguanylate cyclase/phosphodiesterase [Bradyrhizobium sp.]|jgi:diguanylate cyclase (GGDEF)-like protein|uniref:putative bifunctional diguanylate cyclase/phosphodiesterase n=1 Tax=Bradyrhizobium sp. TaxID=376 RepID=UPI003C28879E